MANELVVRTPLRALDSAFVTGSLDASENVTANIVNARTALEQGGKINAITATDTAFSLALKNRHEAISRILLSAGSDWEKGFDEQQTSALIMAADEGFDNIVKMLILTPTVFCNSLMQASKVAPVVITSSINKTCLFFKINVSSKRNLVSLLLNRSNRDLKVCVFEVEALDKIFVMKGFFR